MLLAEREREKHAFDFNLIRALTTFKLEGDVTSLSESSQGEVGEVNCD